jgi:hypothetical protein
MELFEAFSSWAWARHHNVLSWYIRPLFLVPFCYFAFKRSLAGVVLTIVALLSSMFWFPEPSVVSPAVASALETERQYLVGPWPLWKVAVGVLVPGLLAGLAYAFWQRSWLWGALVLNIIAFSKIIWTAIFFEEAGFLAHLAPAAAGLIFCNVGLWLIYLRFRRGEQ